MDLSLEYKDHNIYYDEEDNEWILHRYSPNRVSYDSLKAAKNAIDRKLKQKYIEESVWVLGSIDGWDRDFKNIKQVKATRPHKGDEFWVTDGKNRKAKSGDDIYLNTDNNRKLFMQIAEQENIRDKARECISTLTKQLQTLTEMRPVK